MVYYYLHTRRRYNRLLMLPSGVSLMTNRHGPIIMDAVIMGCRRDLVTKFNEEPVSVSTPSITGSARKDRVLVTNAKARRLLSKYACLERGRYQKRATEMAQNEYKTLCILQFGRDEKVPKILTQVVQGQTDLTDPMNQSDFGLVIKTCPLLKCILNCRTIDSNVRKMLGEMLSSIDKTYGHTIPHDTSYPEPTNVHRKMEFFPNHPLIRGCGKYDITTRDTTSGCRKLTESHQKLTPGLFTMFCPHGICLGFQVMLSCESPQTAFDILMRRFENIPSKIIYDNSCKLHLYTLLREPARFKHCIFYVDRMHFRGHIGCTLGYSMDTYKCDTSVRSINSQVVEQANSGLRRIQTQLTYMPPDNLIIHASVFLAMRNRSKQRL